MVAFSQAHIDGINNFFSEKEKGVICKRVRYDEGAVVIGIPDTPGSVRLRLVDGTTKNPDRGVWVLETFPEALPGDVGRNPEVPLDGKTERLYWRDMLSFLEGVFR